MLDTTALLVPMKNAPTEVDALRELVNANTRALEAIKVELAKATPESTMEGIKMVDQAIQELGLKSQKVDTKRSGATLTPDAQYPVLHPVNPSNPVPLPPGVIPSPIVDAPTQAAVAAQADAAKAAADAKPQPAPRPEPVPPAKEGKR